MSLVGKSCILLRGKDKGVTVEVIGITTPHKLSSETRYSVYITGHGLYHTRRRIVNESALKEITYERYL